MASLDDFCDDLPTSLSLLRNIAAVLEAALERVELPLSLCVRVVRALHSLSYDCAPQLRSLIRETGLPEVRNSYVVRVLLDNSQDYVTRVAALADIRSPLQWYLSAADPTRDGSRGVGGGMGGDIGMGMGGIGGMSGGKSSLVLPERHVVVVLLGLLLEASEDLEFDDPPFSRVPGAEGGF
ncbi:hypothetical protein B484DRAFT_407671 [Ochromonadaceae sp. CCMP2298]|nr:hypothetical protein B484DRAFT_407671 [Ochromonadaceae sp. CCMP2298]